jgi:Bacterial PH domain
MATSVLDPRAGMELSSPTSATPARAHVHGVSEPLPPGERILWEGAPQPRALARHLLFVRPLATYFGLMILWWIAANRATIGTTTFWVTVAMQTALVGFVLGGIVVLSRWLSRSTTYAITDKRLVIRLGIVFPLTVNLPLRYVLGAKTKSFADGTGQIALQLDPKERLAWIVLFPHVRPFAFSEPEPVLRGLTDPAKVGEVLRTAVLSQESAV